MPDVICSDSECRFYEAGKRIAELVDHTSDRFCVTSRRRPRDETPQFLLAVEWDDNAAETYRLNHHGTEVYHGDITALSVDEVLARTGLAPGELDIFDGSPPCQGFSTAGKRICKTVATSYSVSMFEFCKVCPIHQPGN